MNIKDSYIHGSDGKGVVKSLAFATTASEGIAVNDLVVTLADTLGTKIPLTIPTLNLNTTGYAGRIRTLSRSTDAAHYLTFVDSNNSSATAEYLYTDGDITYNPSTNLLTVQKITVTATNGFNYSAIGTGSADSSRDIWFSHNTYHGTPVVDSDFLYNPSTNTLKVVNISGASVWIGDTQLLLNSSGTTNKLTPDQIITNTSTHGTIPSSKAVWDAILSGMQANDAMVFKGFLQGGSSASNTTYTPGANRGDTYKVSTAGYINGTYYQLNDTFICTTDGTVAATSSNVSTVSANWGVIEGNGDFLSIHGGTMDGTLTWKNTTALPASTTVDYILIVSATSNGITKYITKANLTSQLAAGMHWADQTVSISSSNSTTPRFGKVGIGGAVDSTALLKVYGNEIVTGNLTIGGCTLVYDSSTPCLKFTF